MYGSLVDWVKEERPYLLKVLALVGIQIEKRWMSEKTSSEITWLKVWCTQYFSKDNISVTRLFDNVLYHLNIFEHSSQYVYILNLQIIYLHYFTHIFYLYYKLCI